MFLVITRLADGSVANAYPIADTDDRAAALTLGANTEVYLMNAADAKATVTLTRLRLKAGTATTKVVTVGGEIETDPTTITTKEALI